VWGERGKSRSGRGSSPDTNKNSELIAKGFSGGPLLSAGRRTGELPSLQSGRTTSSDRLALSPRIQSEVRQIVQRISGMPGSVDAVSLEREHPELRNFVERGVLVGRGPELTRRISTWGGKRPRGPAPRPRGDPPPPAPSRGRRPCRSARVAGSAFFRGSASLDRRNETAQRSFSGSTTTRSGTGGKSWDYDPARKWKIFEIAEAIWKY